VTNKFNINNKHHINPYLVEFSDEPLAAERISLIFNFEKDFFLFQANLNFC